MNTTPCCSGVYGKSQYSNITNAEINSICGGQHLPAPPFSPTPAEQAAYDQCVSDKRAERAGTRLQTYTSIADWFASAFLGKGRDRGTGDGADGQPPPREGTGAGMIALWIGVILLIIVLSIVAVKYFGKQGGA